MSITTSSTVAAAQQALATQYNGLRLDALQMGGDVNATTGSANAYLLSLDAQIVSITQYAVFKFKASFTNTGAATLNINSIGAISLVKNGSTVLQQGDITSGQAYHVIYDGTNFQLQSPVPMNVQYDTDDQIIHGTMGDTFSSGDLSSNNNLAYLDPTTQTWKKVTATASTWYHKLGLVLEATTSGNVGRIMLRGVYANQTFNNINPTFSSALTGANITIGSNTSNTDQFAAILINNSSGAEAVISGAGTLSVKKTGAPGTALNLWLVLDNQEQSGYPAFQGNPQAAFPTNIVTGAILANTTILAASVTTGYTSVAFNFGSALNIPAGCKVYLVCGILGTGNASNFYSIQSNAATAIAAGDAGGAPEYITWSGTANACNYTLTVTSTSPVGYAVKAYNGTNGNYGLTPTTPWARPIGRVLSSTTFLFDPEWSRMAYAVYAGNVTVSAGNHFATVTTNFCPAYIRARVASQNTGSFSAYMSQEAFIRGDQNSSNFIAVGTGDSDNGALAANAGTGVQSISTNATIGATGPVVPSQNKLHFVRLEQGFYVFAGFPSGAGTTPITVGMTSWTSWKLSLSLYAFAS